MWFLQKPYSAEGLSCTVRDALDFERVVGTGS
jgi:hypothetical protein